MRRSQKWRCWGLALVVGLISCTPTSVTEAPDTAPAPTPEVAVPSVADNPASSGQEPEPSAALPTPLPSEDLWARLQQPEGALYVVLLRHALAPGTGDPAAFQLDDCTTQRNLSDEGRSQAQQIGQAFRERGVAVRQVLSSQWCRCLETAELMDLGEVEPFPALNSFFRDRSTAADQTAAVQAYLLEQAANPGVIVMVTHQVNITALTEYVPRSGEAVILQADAQGLTELGSLLPQ